MSESNNVKFVENNGKWMWKRYDEQGSVIFRSPEFDTERQAREDYDINGGEAQTDSPQPEISNDAGTVSPEEDISAGDATPSQETQPETESTI